MKKNILITKFIIILVITIVSVSSKAASITNHLTIQSFYESEIPNKNIPVTETNHKHNNELEIEEEFLVPQDQSNYKQSIDLKILNSFNKTNNYHDPLVRPPIQQIKI